MSKNVMSFEEFAKVKQEELFNYNEEARKVGLVYGGEGYLPKKLSMEEYYQLYLNGYNSAEENHAGDNHVEENHAEESYIEGSAFGE